MQESLSYQECVFSIYEMFTNDMRGRRDMDSIWYENTNFIWWKYLKVVLLTISLVRGVIGNDAAHGPTFYFEYKLDICWETGSEEENSMKILNVTTYSKAILLPIGKAAVPAVSRPALAIYRYLRPDMSPAPRLAIVKS